MSLPVFVSQGPGGFAQGAIASGTSIPITLPQAPIIGDILFLCFETGGSTNVFVSSISQSGATWQNAVVGNYYVANGREVEIWYSAIISSRVDALITVNLSGDAGAAGAIADVIKFHVPSISSAIVDQSASTFGGGTALLSGTTNPTKQAVEIAVACINSYNTNDSLPLNGFILLDGTPNATAGPLFTLAVLYNILTTTGSVSTGATADVDSSGYAGCVTTTILIVSQPQFYGDGLTSYTC